MTTYTADDFKNARFATHPDGRIAMRRDPGKHNAWFTSNGSIPSDINMAQGGWAPAQECPNPDQHDDRYVSALAVSRVQEVQVRLEQAEQERDELRAALTELAPDEVCVRGDWFKPSELPEVLGRVMDSRDEAQQEAKRYFLRAKQPRPLTAREHLDAAWEAAHVPEGETISKGAWAIQREPGGQILTAYAEHDHVRAREPFAPQMERRLLDPPAPSGDVQRMTGHPLTADDITDETAAKVAKALGDLGHGWVPSHYMHDALVIALTEPPSRPEWEQVESLLREMPPGTVTQGSKWLVERGVRVTGAES